MDAQWVWLLSKIYNDIKFLIESHDLKCLASAESSYPFAQLEF